MKTIVVLAVSIVLVSILFCPMVMSAPSMPNDVQIVQPDPSLPKKLAAFWGKWEGNLGASTEVFVIVEKIDEEKASIYVWRSGFLPPGAPNGWERIEANVIKDRGKYKLWYQSRSGSVQLTLKGEYLVSFSLLGSAYLPRVP